MDGVRITAWIQNGVIHREDDQPAMTYANGIKLWYFHGKQHRSGGLPAYEHPNGDKRWFVDGKKHRTGLLPAEVHPNGVNRWFKYGREYNLEELTAYYSLLTHFGRLCLAKIILNKAKRKKWIHGELLCMPARGNYSGGQDYHEMVDYFTKLS